MGLNYEKFMDFLMGTDIDFDVVNGCSNNGGHTFKTVTIYRAGISIDFEFKDLQLIDLDVQQLEDDMEE